MPKTILDDWRDMLVDLETNNPQFVRQYKQLFDRIGHIVSMYAITQQRLRSMLKEM